MMIQMMIVYNPKRKLWAEIGLPDGLYFYWHNPRTRKVIAEAAEWHHGKPPREPSIITEYPDIPDMDTADFLDKILKEE